MVSKWMNLLVTIFLVTFTPSLGNGGCQSWCPGAARPWETKCRWTMACGGCAECAPSTTGSTTAPPTTTSTTTTKTTTTTSITVSTTKSTVAPTTPTPASTRKSTVITTPTPPITTASTTKLATSTTTMPASTTTTFKATSATPLTTTVTIFKSTNSPEIKKIASVKKRCKTQKLPNDANTISRNINASETAIAIEQLAVEIPCPENNARSITSTVKSTSTLPNSVSTNPQAEDGPKSFWDGLGGDTDDDTLLLMLSTLVGAVIFFLVLIVTIALICSKRRSTVRRTDAISIKLDRKQFDISFSDEGYDDGDDYESDNSSQYSV